MRERIRAGLRRMVGAGEASRRLEAAEAELADVRRALGGAAESIERLDSGARERARQRGEIPGGSGGGQRPRLGPPR